MRSYPPDTRFESDSNSLLCDDKDKARDSYLRNPKHMAGHNNTHNSPRQQGIQALVEILVRENKREKREKSSPAKPDSEPTPLRSCVENGSGSKSALDSCAHTHPLW